jgi:anti-anti-sigma factor
LLGGVLRLVAGIEGNCYSEGYPRRLTGVFMKPAHLEIEKEPNSSSELAINRLEGKLELETVHDFIANMRAESANHLVLDMSGVSFLDSAGVGALVSLFVSRRNAGKKLALASLTQQGKAVIQVCGLQKLLPLYSTVEQAIAAKA